MSNAETPETEDMIARLWGIARAWFADAVYTFGKPAAVAGLLTRAARWPVVRRLKALETLVMKLLLVEAAKLTPAPTRKRAGARAGVTHTHAQGADASSDASNACVSLPDDPSAWRVRFELRIPPEAVERINPNSGPRIRSLGPPLLVRDIYAERARQARLAHMAQLRLARLIPDEARERASAARLARRFEALRRALIDPIPRARLLKRKLIALAGRAYDAAMRLAMRRPPKGETNPLVHLRAEFKSASVVFAAIAPPNTS